MSLSDRVLSLMSLMVIVTYKPLMLSVFKLNVVMLSVIMLDAVAPLAENR